MSATGRSSAAGTGVIRHPDDFYSTPPWATRALLRALSPISLVRETVLDPCCGDGAILDVIGQQWSWMMLAGYEINEQRAEIARSKHSVTRRDALSAMPWTTSASGPLRWIITNPPYGLALQFAQRAIAEISNDGATGTVAMLMRLNWLASQKRAEWMHANTPSVYVLPKRPSFTNKGTDATDYAWMVWRHGDIPRVHILEVEP